MSKFRYAIALVALGTIHVSAQERADAPGTLASHLATNAVARAILPLDELPFNAPNSIGLDRINRARWSPTFWLHGVHGLSATPIGFTKWPLSGQGLPTLVSPRHYLCATHMHPEESLIAFLGTNNVLCYRRTLQRVDIGGDTSIGLLDSDVSPAVEFLPVLPPDFADYLPTLTIKCIQGIGMNQKFLVFPQPIFFGGTGLVNWNPNLPVANGISTNLNVTIVSGDSSNPEMLLIGDQLVLASHNFWARGGPSYAYQSDDINKQMHYLSTNNHCASDYQLHAFCLTNWPKIR